jgi:hypothetical protein
MSEPIKPSFSCPNATFPNPKYVALSRGVSQNSTKVLINEGKIEGED